MEKDLVQQQLADLEVAREQLARQIEGSQIALKALDEKILLLIEDLKEETRE